MSLVPVPSEETSETCPNCSATLVADQRYCLSCGQPVSPVRLAFLDVLQSEYQPQARQGLGLPADGLTAASAQSGYAPAPEPPGLPGWLRRYSGVLGLLGVLLLAMIIGLLVGHWAGQGKAPPARQVVKIEGLSGIPTAAAAPASSTPSTTPPTSKSTAKTEAQEAKEAAKEAKAVKGPPPKPVKISSSSLKKLGSSTGAKHEEEVNKLGDQPIETGGGSSTPAPASPRNRASRSAPAPRWKRSNELGQRTASLCARAGSQRRRRRRASSCPSAAWSPPSGSMAELRRRRLELAERVAALTWDLGGLTYEMAVRDHYRLDVLARRAAELQEADAQLAEVQRLLATAEAGIDGQCRSCGAVHSRGAAYCWHCGVALREEARPAVLSAAGVAGLIDPGRPLDVNRASATRPRPRDQDSSSVRNDSDGCTVAPAARTRSASQWSEVTTQMRPGSLRPPDAARSRRRPSRGVGAGRGRPRSPWRRLAEKAAARTRRSRRRRWPPTSAREGRPGRPSRDVGPSTMHRGGCRSRSCRR